MKEEDAPALAPAQRTVKKNASQAIHPTTDYFNFSGREFYLLAFSRTINNHTLKEVSYGHKI